MRRHIAESRTGAIIDRVAKHRRTELFVLIAGALFALAFHGSNAEGQASILDSWARQYVEEKALVINVSKKVSGAQLADINSVYAGSGGQEASDSPVPTLEASTIRGSALVAMTPPDGEYIEQIASRRSDIIEYTVQEGDFALIYCLRLWGEHEQYYLGEWP